MELPQLAEVPDVEPYRNSACTRCSALEKNIRILKKQVCDMHNFLQANSMVDLLRENAAKDKIISDIQRRTTVFSFFLLSLLITFFSFFLSGNMIEYFKVLFIYLSCFIFFVYSFIHSFIHLFIIFSHIYFLFSLFRSLNLTV